MPNSRCYGLLCRHRSQQQANQYDRPHRTGRAQEVDDNRQEEFWVDKDRINQYEGDTKYALLRLEAISKSGKLTEDNLTKHGFLRAPQGTKELEGDLLKFIERRF